MSILMKGKYMVGHHIMTNDDSFAIYRKENNELRAIQNPANRERKLRNDSNLIAYELCFLNLGENYWAFGEKTISGRGEACSFTLYYFKIDEINHNQNTIRLSELSPDTKKWIKYFKLVKENPNPVLFEANNSVINHVKSAAETILSNGGIPPGFVICNNGLVNRVDIEGYKVKLIITTGENNLNLEEQQPIQNASFARASLDDVNRQNENIDEKIFKFFKPKLSIVEILKLYLNRVEELERGLSPTRTTNREVLNVY